uniref:Ppx/GppA family phosphatase n=1 Tax=Steinernema glaseri TaxID=37863 RepID=A0A1I7XWK9_9BILA
MEQLLAAVDLGSNSFRLSIGRVVQHNGHAQIYTIDRLNESVRLAAGMGPDKYISPDAIERAVVILKRFNERLAGFHPNRVRAVATNTFRVARNLSEVLPAAEAAFGFPIEVISGHEEARLIFSGISNELPPSPNRRLMIDIGGGSTEVIIGKGLKPLLLSSLYMGCVSYTDKFFADGVITEERMSNAILTARQNGMSKKGITLEGMELLRKRLVHDGKVDMRNLSGIKPHRAPVLAAGLAIMMAAFQELKIRQMLPGEGALRVGVLYDMLGRESEHDQRDQTVQQMMKRYQVDTRQSHRVHDAAMQFFAQLKLPDTPEVQELQRQLGWAADLHEVQQDRKVCRIEIRIPGRRTTNRGTQLQIAFDQRWNTRWQIAVQSLDRITIQGLHMRNVLVVLHGLLGYTPDFGGGDTIVAQADAGATQKIAITADSRQGSNTAPQHHDGRAIAYVRAQDLAS